MSNDDDKVGTNDASVPTFTKTSSSRTMINGVEIIANHHRTSSNAQSHSLLTTSTATTTTTSALTRTLSAFARALSFTVKSESAETATVERGDDARANGTERATSTSAAMDDSPDVRTPTMRDDFEEDDIGDECTPDDQSSGSWFNPEQFTAEKRRWLRDQRAMSFDDSDAAGTPSGSGRVTPARKSGPLKMMEAFLVCGLEPDAEVGVVADSPAAAREARMNTLTASSDSPMRITDPRKLRAYRGTAGETYKASTLLHYPSDGEETPKFAVDEVAAFCFPHGVEPRLLERTPSMSKLQEMIYGSTFDDGDEQVFVFQVQTSDNTPMYGVCAYVTEVLHQAPPIVQHARRSTESSSAADESPSDSTPMKSPGGLLKSRYIQIAPRCYCILSRVPFFRTHFEVLSHVLGMERVERIRQNMNDLLPDDGSSDDAALQLSLISSESESMIALRNYLRTSVPPLGEEGGEFVPSEGVKSIQYGRPKPSERITSPVQGPMTCTTCVSAEEEASHLEDWAVVSLCCSLSLENILSLLTAALLEKQIVVFSNNLGELSAVSLALIPMLRPFKWQSLYLPILPQHMVDFLDAPVPFICGVQHKTSDLRARTSHLCRINVYKDDVKLQWEGGKSLRLPRMNDVVRILYPLHQAVVEASANRKKRPVIDPSQAAVEASKEFLGAWRAYVNSLVSSIRYHSITDVNEGGDAKVAILLKESFLGTYTGRDRSFMRAFVETQMFSAYCDERLAN